MHLFVLYDLIVHRLKKQQFLSSFTGEQNSIKSHLHFNFCCISMFYPGKEPYVVGALIVNDSYGHPHR